MGNAAVEVSAWEPGEAVIQAGSFSLARLARSTPRMSPKPVAGDPWQSYLGAGGWTRGDVEQGALQRLYESGEADAQVAVAAADSLGRRVAQMALLLKAGGAALREMLTTDDAYNFFLTRV